MVHIIISLEPLPGLVADVVREGCAGHLGGSEREYA